MSTGEGLPTRAAASRPRRGRPRPRRRVSVVGVLGELLITAGVVVLLFLGWQLWFNDLVMGGQLEAESQELSQEWAQEYAAANPDEAETPADPQPLDDPPTITAPGDTERFANLIVPRFGADYVRPIAEGTNRAIVLNRGDVGHYADTAMPGEVGNFAIAGHRVTYGRPLNQLGELRVGDHLYVETAEGWYRYEYRNLEYVLPTGVGVIDPVPQAPDAQPGERIMTLTSCHPMWSASERIVAYTVFDGWFPRSGGAPAEIAQTVGG
jgi:sortase A